MYSTVLLNTQKSGDISNGEMRETKRLSYAQPNIIRGSRKIAFQEKAICGGYVPGVNYIYKYTV
jgi:hypothetical protein